MSDASASDEKPQSEKKLDPIEELFYLDTIDALTVDLEACQKKVELLEDPPECDGPSWVWYVVAAGVGYILNDLLD